MAHRPAEFDRKMTSKNIENAKRGRNQKGVSLMSRYDGSLLCQVGGLVALLLITGTLVLLPRHSAVADEGGD
jgi:hypothetical protein